MINQRDSKGFVDKCPHMTETNICQRADCMSKIAQDWWVLIVKKMLYEWLSISTSETQWIKHGQWHTQSSAETINSRAELGNEPFWRYTVV